MKISLEWLRRYLPLKRSLEEVEEGLTLIGFEVEGVERIGLPPLENVLVGEVLSMGRHPNADRLTLCQVRVQKGEEANEIVCGASNYEVGDRVAVALSGAVLPGGVKIKRSKIRGVVSNGMMCSARELALGDDHEGIMVLESRPEIGTPIDEVFPEGDVIFDIEITPNRPDCLSYIGVARELGAYFRLPLSLPEISSEDSDESASSPNELLKGVRIETPENCPHYLGYPIAGITIGPSPEWLSRLITAIGLRPVNNVVDVTNYVLHETGQPLHAFDAAKIGGQTIVIRQAQEGEEITTLDDRLRRLEPENMVIADLERPMAVAGVMGSIDAEVDEGTTDVVLESAFFDPTNIRRTSRQLGLSTDASYRFERGVDPSLTKRAARRAIDLIVEVAGGRCLGAPHVGGRPPKFDRKIEIDASFIERQLGFEVEEERIWEIFRSLELEVEEPVEGRDVHKVRIPSHRADLERPIDLVEEFLRIYGTDRIPDSEVSTPTVAQEDDRVSRFRSQAASFFRAQGFSECVNLSMCELEAVEAWYGGESPDLLRLANPLTEDQTHLRPSLIPGLLENLRLNRFRGSDVERLFEIGSIFRADEGTVWELLSVGFLHVKSPRSGGWLVREEPDFYTVSGLAERLLSSVGVDLAGLTFQPLIDEHAWQEGHSGWLGEFRNGFEAKIGTVDLKMLKAWEIEGTVLAGSISFLPAFLRRELPAVSYRPDSPYPSATKDIALVVSETESAETVRSRLESISNEAVADQFAVESVSIFDVFRGEGLPDGTKSFAFALAFRSDQRTLTDDEVNSVFEQIVLRIAEGTGYQLRS